MESWHSLLPHTHTHIYTHVQIAPSTQGYLTTGVVQIIRLNLSFPCLDGIGMFWPFESEQDSNAVYSRAKYVDQAPVELSWLE